MLVCVLEMDPGSKYSYSFGLDRGGGGGGTKSQKVSLRSSSGAFCPCALRPYLMNCEMKPALCGPLYFPQHQLQHVVLSTVTSWSGDQVAHGNGDKHQITPVANKNCLCSSHFVAQAMLLRKKGTF